MKAEAQRAAVQSLLHYLTHFKLSHAIRKNLLLIENMKELAKGGKRNVKSEEFVRVYDILLQVNKDVKKETEGAREGTYIYQEERERGR